MTHHRVWLAAVSLTALVAASLSLARPVQIRAQATQPVSDEMLLSIVIPPLADGSRPGVHLWARADQAQGPGGLPTVFIATLYTKQTSAGAEEHEIVNYVQYSNGAWAPARPRDDGTLLVNDWAWISQNLTDLTAYVSGQGNASQYTLDYTASGPYAGTARQLAIEEVYGADLSLLSSTILTDTNPQPVAAATATSVATPSATATRTPAPAGTPTAPTATVAPVPSLPPTPPAPPSLLVPPAASPTRAAATPVTSPTAVPGRNTISPATQTP